MVVLVYEVLVFLSFPLEGFFPSVNVCWKVALEGEGERWRENTCLILNTGILNGCVVTLLTHSSCHVVARTGGGTPDQLSFRSSSIDTRYKHHRLTGDVKSQNRG